MGRMAIINALIVNEGKRQKGNIIVNGGLIERVIFGDAITIPSFNPQKVINAEGLILIPGVIDDHVHFREPGLTHKGDICSESKAAIAGGVTSIMDMPNTIPQTVTSEELDKKFEIASKSSLANYSFYLGATNHNIQEIIKVDKQKVCGLKLFMGSSTGNMLVDNGESLETIFRSSPVLIGAHCEDEATVKRNTLYYDGIYNHDIPFACHPQIRSAEACYLSSSLAVDLAKKFNTRLHLLHLSTEKEMSLLSPGIPLSQKRITAEVCTHHLWFSDKDYDRQGWRIKWNPAIKTEADKKALMEALIDNRIDLIVTDHAPHLQSEKENTYTKCPSGGPMVQHSLVAMLEMARQGALTIEQVVDKMCHAPSTLFNIDKRGYIREGYHADIVLINPKAKWEVTKGNILYKCGWSPMEGQTFSHRITHTFVNGRLVFENGKFDESVKGSALIFNR